MAITSSRVAVTVENNTGYRTFFVSVPADQNLLLSKEGWTIVSVDYTSSVAGTDGGAVTAMLKKCTGTQAPSAGTDLLSAAIDLKTTANTTASGTLVSNQSTLAFSAGDRLALDVTGTPTAVAGVFMVGYKKAT